MATVNVRTVVTFKGIVSWEKYYVAGVANNVYFLPRLVGIGDSFYNNSLRCMFIIYKFTFKCCFIIF